MLERRRASSGAVALGVWLTVVQTASAQTRPNTFDPPAPTATAPTTAPIVRADRTVTLRLGAPQARVVEVVGFAPQNAPIAMARSDSGVWSVTLGPLKPQRYQYIFRVDGLEIADPANGRVEVGRSWHRSLLDVPASSPTIDEERDDVPHGVLRVHRYRSKIVGLRREMLVYVPPQYDARLDDRYPVLYLRHGNGDTPWWWVGPAGAQNIVDNLLAEGQTVPMIVVMPNGYPSLDGVGSTDEGLEVTRRELMEEIIPFVEERYRTIRDREHRAIAGFSMGAAQAFYTGLHNLEQFAWVGEFSAAYVSRASLNPAVDFAAFLGNPQATNARLRLLYLACGTEDPRINGQLNLSDTFKARGLRHELFTAPGNHTPQFAGLALADFLPRLFRPT